MKKSYKLVSTNKTNDGWETHLDGRPVKTATKKILLAPNEAIANAVQKEWAEQGDQIDPETMPLTQILTTQIDNVSTQREAMTTAILKYLDTDLICYFAGDLPEGQREKQEEQWNPWLAWFEKRFSTPLKTTTTLNALAQPAAAHKAVKKYVEALDDARFTILQILVPLTGSLILAIAFNENAITPEEIFNATHAEEHFKDQIYNADFYGLDPLQESKDNTMKRDLAAAKFFLQNL